MKVEVVSEPVAVPDRFYSGHGGCHKVSEEELTRRIIDMSLKVEQDS